MGGGEEGDCRGELRLPAQALGLMGMDGALTAQLGADDGPVLLCARGSPFCELLGTDWGLPCAWHGLGI